MIYGIKDAPLEDKNIVIRLDLNVPVQDGQVTDTTRIDRVKPTIDALREAGASKITILSHFGRPKGEEKPEFSLGFLSPVLSRCWGVDVGFGANSAEKITLLENLRFNPGEEKNDPDFAKELAAHGDIYINDAFSVSHRAHASVEAITKLLPSYAGLNLHKEIDALEKALSTPKKPVAAIIGGAKVSSKLSLIKNLLPKMDMIVLGGGMANTFFLAEGHDVGKSLAEADMTEEAKSILAEAKAKNCEIILPMDGLMAKEFAKGADYRETSIDNIASDEMMLDIGTQSAEMIKEKLGVAKTVLWNGPMGAFETPPFDHGTVAVARYVAERTKSGDVLSIGGGGDTVSALSHAGVSDDFSYISTAGGAFLEWLEGKTLPGIAALDR